jgi:hypothetical protein
MRTFPVFVALVLCSSAAFAQSPPPEDRTVAVGPWQIEASYRSGDTFDRCIMTRKTEDGIELRITRDDRGLTLILTSPRWKLEEGKAYPVEFAADAISWKADVLASPDAVRVALSDGAFNRGLRIANRLEIRAAGATFLVPLNRSAAALTRLERCYETNSKAVETNPFVKPEMKP